MNHNWGADRRAGKRRKHHPIWAWMPVIVVLASMLAICTYHYIEVWTPLQRFYFKTYILTGLRSVGGKANSGHYEVLAVTMKNGSHWASDGEVTEARAESGGTTIALRQEALKNGGLHLVLVTVQSDDGNLYDFLRQAIYRDQSVVVLLRQALWGGLAVLFLWPTITLFGEAVGDYRLRQSRKLNASGLVSPQVLAGRNPLHGAGLGPTHKNPPVAALAKRSMFRDTSPTKVEPHERPTVLKTTVSADDDAPQKIMQDEIKQEPEYKSKPKPARKERYFQ